MSQNISELIFHPIMSNSTIYPYVSAEAKDEYLTMCEKRGARLWPNLENGEERFINTPYGQTFLRIGGPLDAPPLLCVPGDEETSLAFAYIAEPLSKEFRVFSLDRIGDVGRSIPNPERVIHCTDDIVHWFYKWWQW